MCDASRMLTITQIDVLGSQRCCRLQRTKNIQLGVDVCSARRISFAPTGLRDEVQQIPGCVQIVNTRPVLFSAVVRTIF